MTRDAEMLEALARVAAEAEADELPAIVGALAQAQALALARIVRPVSESPR